MPMPHRTFAQVAKRRLARKRGPGAHPRGQCAARGAARLQERSVRGPAQVAAGRDRGHARPLERRPSRFHRGAARGRRPDRARRAAQRRQVVAPPGAVRDPDQDRRLPVHDAAAGAGADAHRRRARPARRDPGPHRAARTTTAAAGARCSACCVPPTRSSTAPGRTAIRASSSRHRRGRDGRNRRTRRSSRRRARTRPPMNSWPPCARAFRTLDVLAVSVLDDASLDALCERIWQLTGLIRVRLRKDGEVAESRSR